MSYNNGFPVTYPQIYPQVQYPQYQYVPQYTQPTQQPVQQTQQIYAAWVDGKVAAQATQAPFGVNYALFFDNNTPYVYKKEIGTDGKPLPMETYRLVQEEEAPAPVQQADLKGYVKEDEVEEIVRREVEGRMSEISFKPTRKTKNTEE